MPGRPGSHLYKYKTHSRSITCNLISIVKIKAWRTAQFRVPNNKHHLHHVDVIFEDS